nr:hypothetical protein [uncultured Eisenbergiella sp.]
MKKRIFSLLFLLLLLFITGWRQEPRPVVKTFGLTPSTEGAEAFSALHRSSAAGYGQETCYKVTPAALSEEYGIAVYKYDSSCASFLLYEDAVYPLGTWFGGFGVTSFALADMNRDGREEVYFTFSWGSGMHRSQIGYFDTAQRTVTVFDYSNYEGDMVLKTDGKGSLYACNAVCDAASFVDIQLTPVSKAASVECRLGLISLVPQESSSWTEAQNIPGTELSVQ